MEDDQQVDVGSAASLSGKTKGETVPQEKIGVKNQAQECYEGGGGDEIMVGTVGSDVFVDGVGGDKGSNFGIKEIGDLDGNPLGNIEETGTCNNSEAVNVVVSEGDGKELDKTEPVNALGEEKLIKDHDTVGPELTNHPTEGKNTMEEKEVKSYATNNGDNGGVQVEVSEVSHKPDAESDDARDIITNERSETDVVRENHATSNQTSQLAVGVCSKTFEEVNKEKNINNEPQVDSDQIHVATSVINDQKDEVSAGNFLDRDTCDEIVEGIDSDDTVRDKTENKPLDASASNISFSGEGCAGLSAGVDSNKYNGYHVEEAHTSETEAMDVDHKTEHHGGNEKPLSETMNLSNKEMLRPQRRLKINQMGYFSPTEINVRFSPGDLVWGKVRSHPWWPGQIFDSADASEMALKYFKKDSYLVAYFGDHTFAWNDASVLKPFGPDFTQIEMQSNSEAFQNAVDCALQEVSRRTELGLTCSCIPKDVYGEIEAQVVENTGLREESSRRHGLDESFGPVSFEPDKLLKFVKDLASCATSGVDRVDLAITRAQLSGFCRFKGYRLPSGFPSTGELLEIDADVDEAARTRKRKHVPEDATESKKERSIAELMHQEDHTMEAGDESDEKMSVYGAKVSASTSQTPKPSFKIGECIRRVASQLTGATSSAKSNNDENANDASVDKLFERQSVAVSAESFSVDEMLSQLTLLGQNPKKKQNLCNPTRMFFSLFRSSIALNKRGRKKKNATAEEFEFDDVNDSYWTGRIVQNYPEGQLLQNNENGNLQLTPDDLEKHMKRGLKPHSKKRYSTESYLVDAKEEEAAKRRKRESSPAELILSFAERNYIPAEINLNKIFRRFGPIMESETEVDVDSGRARVIFKRGSDAEVAHSSAEKFNIFGSVLVNYQIGYTPVISVKILPIVVAQSHGDPMLMV